MAKKSKITPLSWEDIENLAPTIAENLSDKEFVSAIINDSIAVAKDSSLLTRGNLIAAALRELISYSLHSLAPDDLVSNCPWYVLQEETNGPTRAQRAQYITQAGLDDEFVEEELDLNPRAVRKPITDAMNQLSKHTHVRPGRLLNDDFEIRRIVTACFSCLDGLFKSANECRKSIEEALIDHIDQAVADKLIGDVIADLDELSTHTMVEGHDIDSIEVSSIDNEFIYFEVNGSVNVDLQYGSNSDVRNDMGHVSSASFPYSATLQSKVKSPKTFIAEEVEVTPDTSSFYE